MQLSWTDAHIYFNVDIIIFSSFFKVSQIFTIPTLSLIDIPILQSKN